MIKVLSLLICLIFVGFAAAGEDGPLHLSRRFISLRQVRRGMTQKEVAAVLHDKVITGYEMSQMKTGQYKPITVDNPHRVEVFKKGSKEFQIYYYLVGITKADGQVTDDELVPIVFKKNKVIGKGWKFLNQKIKK